MPVIAIAPIVLTDVVMTIGTDDYQTNLSKVRFEPKVNTVTWQGLTPASAYAGATSPIWECVLEYAQDWTTTNSLAAYLLTNQGAQKTAVFKPIGTTTGKPIFTATVIIVPGPIGGDVNTVQTGQVTLPVVGAPVKTTAP